MIAATPTQALRALRRLAAPETALAPIPGEAGWGVYRGSDRRRRPRARVSAAVAEAWRRDGALEPTGRGAELRLSAAGLARLERESGGEAPAMLAQAGPRSGGRAGFLAGLTRVEAGALTRFLADLEASQAGLAVASDWTAPPRGATARGAPGESMDRGHDARRRVSRAMAALAPPLAELLRAALIEGQGLETIERRRGWPARAGRVAMRCALAQLAHHYREAAPAAEAA